MITLGRVRGELWPDDRWRRLIHSVGAAVGSGTVLALAFRAFGHGPGPGESLVTALGSLSLLGGILLASVVPHALGSLAVRAARRPAWVGVGWALACVGDLATRVYILGGFLDDPLALIGLLTFPMGWTVLVVGGLAAEYVFRSTRDVPDAVSKGWTGGVTAAALVGFVGAGAQCAGWATLSLLLWCVAVAGGGLGALVGSSPSC